MPIANLANMPNTPDEMANWSFSHLAHHRDLADFVYRTMAIQLQVYLIDPINTSEASGFLEQHQSMHDDLDAILGTPGYDLIAVQWNDKGERGGWIELNFQAHLGYAQATGVG